MSTGTSVIVATVFCFVLTSIQFYLAWRLPASDEDPRTLDDIVPFFRSFGHIEWGGSYGSYGPWGSGHWSQGSYSRS